MNTDRDHEIQLRLLMTEKPTFFITGKTCKAVRSVQYKQSFNLREMKKKHSICSSYLGLAENNLKKSYAQSTC